MATNGNQIESKMSNSFCCKICSYNTVRKPNYERHLLTGRHILATNVNQNESKMSNVKCLNCNKCYKDRTGLWKHKKKCTPAFANIDDVLQQNKDILQQNQELNKILIDQSKQTAELQTQVIELCKNGITHTTTTHNTNTFNLNFFLNDTCKDAMNLEDFINSLVWQIADLKMVGELGYVKGVSKLITDKLSLLSEDKRPIHCTDVKREVMYVRDDDKWEKEHDDNPKLHRAVKRVSRQESVLPAMAEYRNMNPGYNVSESNISTEYQLIISEALCGGDEQEEVDTIIKNISKKVIINKTK